MYAYVGSFTTAHRKAREQGHGAHATHIYTLDPAGEKRYVANEDSDTIVAFKLDATNGKPLPTGLVIATRSPSCIVFAK